MSQLCAFGGGGGGGGGTARRLVDNTQGRMKCFAALKSVCVKTNAITCADDLQKKF